MPGEIPQSGRENSPVRAPNDHQVGEPTGDTGDTGESGDVRGNPPLRKCKYVAF
jgi:hypothetical protein